MSALATSTGSQSVAVLGGNTVPLTYDVGIEGTITVLAASAVFTGTVSDGCFPCLTFYDSDGNLLSRADSPFIGAGSSGRVSWFPGAMTIAVNAAFFDQVGSMAPNIDLDKGCVIAFESPLADGTPQPGVTIADALLRVQVAGGGQVTLGPWALVPGPETGNGSDNVPEPTGPGTNL